MARAQQAVDLARARRQDLAGPIRRHREVGGIRHLGHALAAPARQVWHHDVPGEVELGPVQDQPPARAPAPAIEWPPDVDAHGRGRTGVRARRPWVHVERALDDLRQLVVWHREEVLVRGVARRLGHVASR